MENTEEMFILGKYKYIRHLTKSVSNGLNSMIPSFDISQNNILDEKAQAKADKEAKKKRMMELCQKKTTKPVPIAKAKYINTTPHGEKKGNIHK